MMRMQDPVRRFGLTLICVWLVLCIAGFSYAYLQSISTSVALAIIPAFLIEAAFYLIPGFPAVRQSIQRSLPQRTIAFLLALSAILPYSVYSVPAGDFRWTSLALLALLASTVSFWYVWLPRNAIADIAFLALMAGVVIAKLFSVIYLSPAPGVRLEILGQLMWTRLGIMAILSIRRTEKINFGFVPSRSEWGIGFRNCLYFLPVGLPLALGIGAVRFHPVDKQWWVAVPLAAATFLGMLWVVALAEEFFFRGLLQQWVSRWLASERAGLLIASLLFGFVHLPFRSFPNWKFAAVAALAGWFYGRAYLQSRSVRAAMVTHALVSTTMRILFS
jgi:membrane protease YdiL (CAAX protease family)